MKKIFSLIVGASFLMASCTKQQHGADDLIPHQQGVEDNLNGGGGNNAVLVPAAVLTAFHSRYTDATKVEWKNLSDGSFKAEFFRGSIRWQASFTSNGTLVKEEHD
jgi:hypothetical protein